MRLSVLSDENMCESWRACLATSKTLDRGEGSAACIVQRLVKTTGSLAAGGWFAVNDKPEIQSVNPIKPAAPPSQREGLMACTTSSGDKPRGRAA